MFTNIKIWKAKKKSYRGFSIPEKTRLVKYSRLIGLIHKITKINGNTKLMFNSNCSNFLSLQYLMESQCIRAIRRPGNVNMAPRSPQDTAIVNLTMIFEAGPLQIKIEMIIVIFCSNLNLGDTYDEATPRSSKYTDAL